MTLFGDLDVTTLREMPPGRQEVRTYLVEPAEQPRWWHFVREKLRAGRQAYVVAPLVDESENIAAASVAEAFERLTNGELAAFRVGMIHGRMSPAEKEQAMADFRAGRTQVLVSTSVIEVGVDVPNACIMVIDSPERFGLAQLHQLRGRVGRGMHGRLLRRAGRARQLSRAGPRTTRGVCRHDGRLSNWPRWISSSAGQATCSARSSTACRRCESPICGATGQVLEEARQQAQQLFAADPGSQGCRNTRGCGVRCSSATGGPWSSGRRGIDPSKRRISRISGKTPRLLQGRPVQLGRKAHRAKGLQSAI